MQAAPTVNPSGAARHLPLHRGGFGSVRSANRSGGADHRTLRKCLQPLSLAVGMTEGLQLRLSIDDAERCRSSAQLGVKRK